MSSAVESKQQDVSNGDGDYQIIKEGRAVITYPRENEVFYNKVQILNRDLSICAVRLFDRTRRASVSQKIARRHTYNRGVLEAEQAGAPKPDPLPPVDETSDYKMPGMRILEALAASGLRSIRYFKEIPNVDHIVVNDLSEDAVASIRRNVTFNGLDPAKVIPHQGDAVALMMQNRSMHNSFDVVDLDPYGTPNLFIDSAVQSVGDGGLICITATDTMTLCGANLDAAHAKYGSVVLKTKCCHEVALRTVLATVARHAAIYKRCIEPLISVSVDFYIRMFVRVKTSAAGAKQAGTKQSMYFQCKGCHTIHFQPVAVLDNRGKLKPSSGPCVPQACVECGSGFQMGGPIWSAPMSDDTFVKQLLADLEAGIDTHAPPAEGDSGAAAGAGAGAGAGAAAGAEVKTGVRTTLGCDAGSNSEETVKQSRKRLTGLIRAYSHELSDCPLFFDLPSMCSVIKVNSPPMLTVMSAIINGGYKVSQSHTSATAVKTNAPAEFVWDVMRAWERKHPVHDRHKQGDTVTARVLNKEIKHKIDFNSTPETRQLWASIQEHSRFLDNPETYWGPKSRASGKRTNPSATDSANGQAKSKRARK